MSQSASLSDTAFELDGDLQELGRLMELVGDFCQAEGMDGDAAFELTLVLEELFTNAVRHGGCEGMKSAVAITLRHMGEGEVSVDYRDRGRPFDPMTAPPPDLHTPLEDRKSGGLGIHLVKQIMHDLQYQRSGEWNRITMRRDPRQEAKSI
jgi:serine/threonine-protein kinase RsbW